MRRDLKNKTTLAFILILAASTLVRLFLSVFPKTAATYFDELFYLELSQNIWLRGTLTVYHTPIHFTKLLYPLVLSPFYAVSDGILRIKLICAFNALLISSSLVPGWLLSRRILKKDWQVILSLLFLALSPNLLFSLTFMAENLYIPLLLWGFYAAYRFFASERKKPLHALLLGALAFILYFAKEIGAAWIAGLAAALFFAGTGKKNSRKEALLLPGCFLAGCLVPFLLTRFVLLRGTGYSYSAQVSLANLSGAPQIMYLLYTAGMLLLYFLLTVGLFPVLLPAAEFKKLSPANRSLFLLAVFYIFFAAFGVAFGVSLYADFPAVDFRLHLRYLAGAAFPFLLLGFAALEEAGPVSRKSALLRLSAAAAVLLVVFLAIPGFFYFVDSPALQFTQLLNGASLKQLWAWKLAPVCLLAVMLLLWNKRKKQAFACLLLPLLLAFELFSGVVFTNNARKAETLSDDALASEVRQLDELLDTLEGTTLVLSETGSDRSLICLDSLSDNDYAFASTESIRNLLLDAEEPAGPALSLQSLPDTLSWYSGHDCLDLSRIGTVVTVGRCGLLDPAAYEEITPEGFSVFHVYKPSDPSVLSLRDLSVYTLGEEITFNKSDAAFRNYRPSGFSGPEKDFTWTNATEASLTLRPDVKEPVDLTVLWGWRMTIGEQPCQVFANDIPVLDATVSGSDRSLSFIVPAEAYAETGVLTLRFDLPEARQPGNGDARTLAVAFERLVIGAK